MGRFDGREDGKGRKLNRDASLSLFSLALGVKMNILLYLPGLMLIYWKALGPTKLVLHLVGIGLVQVRSRRASLSLFFLRLHEPLYLMVPFSFLPFLHK